MPQLKSREAAPESWAAAAFPQFEITGAADASVVVALGGISASRHVTSNAKDRTPGWWEKIAGEHRAIDTTRHRILCFDFLDGGCRADGRPERLVTTHDQADALAAVLDYLGIERLHAIVGASYGGMVALAFAEKYPEKLGRLVAISAPHEPHPMSTALRGIQRRVVELGLETGRGGEALALARGLAVTTYRSAREFGERFDSRPARQDGTSVTFPVEDYLGHQGERFVARCSPARFLALSLSTDLHRVDPSRVIAPTTLIAAEGDTIVPRVQLQSLGERLRGPVELLEIPTLFGHDAFLTEPDKLGAILRTALSSPTLP